MLNEKMIHSGRTIVKGIRTFLLLPKETTGATVGTKAFVGLRKNGTLLVSLYSPTATATIEKVVKAFGNKNAPSLYIDLTDELGYGYYNTYRVSLYGKRANEFVVTRLNHNEITPRLETEWYRGIARITAYGNMIVPSEIRNTLFGRGAKLKGYVDVKDKDNPIVRISVYDPTIDVLPTREQLVDKMGLNYVFAIDEFEYAIPKSYGGSIPLPLAVANLFGDGVFYSYDKKSKTLELSSRSFLSNVHSPVEEGIFGKKKTVCLCPNCLRKLKSFKTDFVASSMKSDREIINDGFDAANKRIDAENKINSRLDALLAKYKK